VVAKPLDRRDLSAGDGVDELQAGEDRNAVDLHGARPAVTLVAGDLGAGQPEVLAQNVSERCPHRRFHLVALAVDAQLKHAVSRR
jgi:hypothetical protein